MNKKLFYFLFFITFLSNSQTLENSVSLNINKKADVFQIVEENKNQVSLFFSDKRKVHSIRFNEKLNVIDSISTERPNLNYDDIIGYSLTDNQYFVYWSNSNGKEIISQNFDFNTKKVNSKAITLVFEKEKIIKKITVNNVFYIITSIKNTSILNFYTFKNGNFTKNIIDLSDKRFMDKRNNLVKLWDIVSVSTDFELPFNFETISNESPPSLAFSANKRKVYVNNNKLVFVIDVNKKFTQSITVNLTDFTNSVKMYSQPFYSEDSEETTQEGQVASYCDSNSFLLNDKLIQIKLNSDFITISIKNNEGEEIKSFLINNLDIAFKNSDIIQENGSVKSTRILEKSSQLLRKIGGLNPSISLYTVGDKIFMIIGGVSIVQQNNAALYGGMFGITGALIGAAISSNYSLNNLNSYKGRKVVYINCLFDQNFNHISGDVKRTAFDELRAFSEKNEKLITPIIFKWNSSLIFGGYDKEKKMYLFYKFND